MRVLQIIVAIGLAVALFFLAAVNRFQIAATEQSNIAIVFRSDSLTGRVESCAPVLAQQSRQSQPDWCPQLINPIVAQGQHDKVKLAERGATQEEIASWENWRRQKMAAEGLTQSEIDEYFGVKGNR